MTEVRDGRHGLSDSPAASLSKCCREEGTMVENEYADYPRRNPNDRIEDCGVNALEQLLRDGELPHFRVPQREDYGLDVLAQVTVPIHDDSADPSAHSVWVRRWMASTLASASGTPPKYNAVVGQFIGFQVKASSRFQPDQDSWTVTVTRRHLNYWQGCDFPVMIVASDLEGNLRYKEFSAITVDSWTLRHGSVRISVTDPLGGNEVGEMQSRCRAAAAMDVARVRALDVFADDEDVQQMAVDACWAVALEPRIVRLLLHSAPQLHPNPRVDAVRLLAAILRFFDEYPDDPDAEVMFREFGFAAPPRYNDEDWATIIGFWEEERCYLIRHEMLPLPDGAVVSVPDDPWPDREGEVYNVARWRYDWLRPPSPWDAALRVLMLATDLVAIVLRLAVDDLSCDGSVKSSTWWVSLLFRAAVENHYAAGGDPRGARAAAADILWRLVHAVPGMADDAEVTKLASSLAGKEGG